MQLKTTQNDFKTESKPEKSMKDKPKKKPKINPKTDSITEIKVSESKITNQQYENDIKPLPEQNKSDDSKKDQTPKKKGLFGGLFKVGLKLYSEIYQNVRIMKKFFGHHVWHQK